MAHLDSKSDAEGGSLNRIFIGSLSKTVSEAAVLKTLRYKGYHAEDVKIIRDVNGRSKGYGFVDLERSSEGKVQTAHLLSQYRMWFELDSRNGFFAIFKPAYRRNRGSVHIVKEITTNDVFTESAMQIVNERDLKAAEEDHKVQESDCVGIYPPIMNLQQHCSPSPSIWMPVFQYTAPDPSSGWVLYHMN